MGRRRFKEKFVFLPFLLFVVEATFTSHFIVKDAYLVILVFIILSMYYMCIQFSLESALYIGFSIVNLEILNSLASQIFELLSFLVCRI